MATVVDNNIFCITIQKKARMLAEREINSVGPDQGLLAYITSPENVQSKKFDPTLDTDDGKIHTGRIRFIPRGTSADYVGVINGNVCEPGATLPYMKDEFTIGQTFLSTKMTFSYNEMRNFCEGVDEHIAEVIYSRMKAARSALNAQIWTRLLAGGYIGNFAGGVAGPKAIPLFMTTDNKINPVGEITIDQDMTAAEISGVQPRLIGANLIQSYMTMKGIQCCNTLGFNAGLLNSIRGFYLDTNFDRIMGTQSNLLALIPGALQLITVNWNKGRFMINTPDHTATTLADPVIPGLVYDMYTHRNLCDPSGNDNVTYTVQLKLRWDLWGYPNGLFQASDNLTGVKDVYHYLAECSDDNVCALAGQEAAPIALFSQEETAPDEITFDTTASEAQAPGAALETYVWDFGGTTGVKSGNAGETITGVTGITGTYDAPVIDKTTANVGTEICLVVIDDNLNEAVKFCDELI